MTPMQLLYLFILLVLGCWLNRIVRKLRSEIDSYKVEAKRDAVTLDYYRSEIRKYQEADKIMQDRVENRR